jgi:hypothetical protein
MSNAPVPRTAGGGTFSTYAEQKMWNLYKDSANQVGKYYPGDRHGRKVTDCITYVREVLEDAFQRTGDPAGAAGVRQRVVHGTVMARYLVINKGWKAYYWNPSVRAPRDQSPEHTDSYRKALSTGKYYDIPVSGYVIDYNPVVRQRDRPKMMAFNALSRVRFAFGVTRGGTHTFLFSYGMVFEVHWDGSGASLYGHKSLFSYPWCSGAVVIPPDSHLILPPER